VPKYHDTAQAGKDDGPAERATTLSSTNSTDSNSTSHFFPDPKIYLALDSMSNICVMPEDVAVDFVKNRHWKQRQLKRNVHMGASSHDGTVVLRNIVYDPSNKFQQPFYITPTGTMTICTTDYISRLGLLFIILPYQKGFAIKQPEGKILYQAEPASDKFHYITWDAFNDLKPAISSLSLNRFQQSDVEDIIADICTELDIIDTKLQKSQSLGVNATAKDRHIPSEIVRIIIEAHVRYGHQSPKDLAMVIAHGARADIPNYSI